MLNVEHLIVKTTINKQRNLQLLCMVLNISDWEKKGLLTLWQNDIISR